MLVAPAAIAEKRCNVHGWSRDNGWYPLAMKGVKGQSHTRESNNFVMPGRGVYRGGSVLQATDPATPSTPSVKFPGSFAR